MAGFGARTALELGLDLTNSTLTSEETTFEPLPPYMPSGGILFCCIYDLDLRSSLMVELPSVLPYKLRQEHLNSLV